MLGNLEWEKKKNQKELSYGKRVSTDLGAMCRAARRILRNPANREGAEMEVADRLQFTMRDGFEAGPQEGGRSAAPWKPYKNWIYCLGGPVA